MYRDGALASEIVRTFVVYTHGGKPDGKDGPSMTPAAMEVAVRTLTEQGYRVKLLNSCPSSDRAVLVIYVFELGAT